MQHVSIESAAVSLIYKSGFLSRLLEKYTLRLTNWQHMIDSVPFIVFQEKANMKAEIMGKPVSAISNGTTRLEEEMAIVTMLMIPLLFSSTLIANS